MIVSGRGLTLSVKRSCQTPKADLTMSFCAHCKPLTWEVRMALVRLDRNWRVLRQDLTSCSVFSHSVASACVIMLSMSPHAS